MSHFVYDLTPLNADKIDLSPIPVGADPKQYVQADSDWNPVAQACLDLRDMVLQGKFNGFMPVVSDPAPTGVDNYLWLRSDYTLFLHTPGSNVTFLTGGRQIITNLYSGLQGGGSLNADLTLSLEDLYDGLWQPKWLGETRGPWNKFYINKRGQITSGELRSYVESTRTISGTSGRITGGGDLSADRSFDLAELDPSPAGDFTTANITVDVYGRVTAAASGVSSPLTDKGDIYTYADDPSDHVERLPVGDDGQFLTADSSTHTGLLWKTLVTTLQGSYDGYSTAPAKIILDSTRKGLVIQDASPTLGSSEGLLTVLDTAGTGTYFTVKGDGKVGINTSTPAARFEVKETTAAYPVMKLSNTYNNGTYATIAFHNEADTFIGEIGCANSNVALVPIRNGFYFQTADSKPIGFIQGTTTPFYAFYVDSTGKVGIGTTEPGGALDVNGAAQILGDRRAVIFAADNTTSAIGTGGGISFVGKDSAGNYGDLAGAKGVRENNTVSNWDGAYVIYTRLQSRSPQLQEAVRVNSAGWVGIGTNSPTAMLDVHGDLLVESANGRILGINGLASGHTVHFRYGGDVETEIEATYGAGTLFKSYHGVTIQNNLGGSGVLGPALIVKGCSNQNLQQWQDASGNIKASISATGDLTVTGALGLYTYTAGETLAQYDVVYAYCEGGTSGRLKKATNAAESTSRVVGVVVTGNTAGNAATIVMAGVYKMTFTGTAPAITDFGKPVYLSGTAGAVTLTAPGAGTVLLRVGYLVGIGAQAEVSIHIGDEFQQ